MAKILRVIDPFLVMEIGDTFEYNEESGMYVYQRKEEYYENDADSIKEVKSIFSTDFQISTEYAKSLIKDGYLEEASELTDKTTPFVNIFDEIDTLLDTYTTQLNSIDEDLKDIPACVKVERQTVLQNMITLLKHLKSLKK
jgi:hypothetical protein